MRTLTLIAWRAHRGPTTPRMIIRAAPSIAAAGRSIFKTPTLRAEIRTYVRTKTTAPTTKTYSTGARDCVLSMELSPRVSWGSSRTVLRTFSGRILKYPHPFGAMLPARCDGRERGRNPSQGVGTMNNAGLMRIGAMLAMLAVLTGAFAALPYWNARAADRTIWGFVDECNPAAPGPSFLPNVVVSLIDAHGLRPTVNTSTSTDGYYTFTPATGSYELKFTATEHYYNKTVYPFRFDGSRDLNINDCLYRMPARTQSLTVLVVDQTSALHMNERLDDRFVRIPFLENIAEPVRAGTGTATLSHHPVLKPGYTVTWRDPPAGTVLLAEPGDYTLQPFDGTITISNAAVLGSLSGTGSNGKWLNVSYQYSATTVPVLYSPVVLGSYLLRKNGASWMPAENSDWKLDLDTGTLTIL